jgi:hypothetical protein
MCPQVAYGHEHNHARYGGMGCGKMGHVRSSLDLNLTNWHWSASVQTGLVNVPVALRYVIGHTTEVRVDYCREIIMHSVEVLAWLRLDHHVHRSSGVPIGRLRCHSGQFGLFGSSVHRWDFV